jgi:hypothetical protein
VEKPQLIINADGYGLTAGTNRAIEECVRFGTVKSVSVNVNFPRAEELPRLVKAYPWLSVGCHLNPVVGDPVLPKEKVRSLLNAEGAFWYREFDWKLASGRVDLAELRAELFAQIDRCRELAGESFTHVDCHMAKHRLPRFYPIFLEACLHSGVGRARVHRYCLAGARRGRFATGLRYYMRHPHRLGVRVWNFRLRQKARKAGLALTDWSIALAGTNGDGPSLPVWISLLAQVRPGFSELVVHPGYGDDELRRISRYVGERDAERRILTSEAFKEALFSSVSLASYHDMPQQARKEGRLWPQ